LEESDLEVSNDEFMTAPSIGFKDVPVFKVSMEEKERLRQPWRRSLIIKVLGQMLGYNLIYKKLLQLYSTKEN